MTTATKNNQELPFLTDEQMARFLPTSVELHLRPSSDFTKHGWSKRVKAAGGEYTEARGHASKRYVTLPLSERQLINDLLLVFPSYKKTTVVFRGGFGGWKPHAWVVVHDIPNVSSDIADALDKLKSYINHPTRDQCRREIQRVLDDERERAERKERAPLRDAYRALCAAEDALQAAMDADNITGYHGLTKQKLDVKRAWEARFPGEDIEAWR